MLSPLIDRAGLAVYPASFQAADAAFMGAIERLPCQYDIQTLAYDGEGPEGEALATRLVWLGGHSCRQVLVLLSAVHGVEGFAGSAIQQDVIQRLTAGDIRLPPDLAVVMVHAVNPWGFAWCRRVDEQGIDVNRNFVDFAQPLPQNPGYERLADAVIPVRDTWAQADERLAAYRQAVGQYEYELAVSGGQYQYADGLFYGGVGLSQARRHMETIISELDCARRSVAVIDLHTGLGPYGHGEIICDHPLASAGLTTAQRWYGDAVTIPEGGDSCSVPKTGLVDYAWHDVMAASSCYITLEFGTYPINELLRCLREDHAIRKPGQLSWTDPQQQSVRDQLRRQFYPAESQWQTLVLLRARQVIQLACAGLLNDRS